jgi:hypothetical protein
MNEREPQGQLDIAAVAAIAVASLLLTAGVGVMAFSAANKREEAAASPAPPGEPAAAIAAPPVTVGAGSVPMASPQAPRSMPGGGPPLGTRAAAAAARPRVNGEQEPR